MASGRDEEAEEANGISYPSPGGEAMEAGPFYHTNGRESSQERQAHEEQHVGDQSQSQSQDPDQPQDHGHMAGQDAGANSQHVSRPANLEELQLAAQLGQGLAGAPIMSATDPNMNVDDSNMRNILPHPEADGQHTPSYVQGTPTSDHMVQHPMQVPVGALPGQYGLGDGIPPRKRSKVSRACDECRRKKIKCDAQSDTGESPCTSCARSSIRCLFSRVPQKRGPSKGYIKELADRINSIESKLESDGSLSQDDIERLFGGERTRTHSGLAPAEEPSRKRPFSSISSGDYNTPSSNRQAPWGNDRQNQPSSAQSENHATPSVNNSSLAPQPSAMKQDETPSKPPPGSTDAPMPDVEELPDIDEGILQDYLSAVQPVYPILPTSKARLEPLLANTPPLVQTAFATALRLVGQNSSSSSADAKLASSLLHEWESTDGPHDRVTDIVHAQTLLLLIIDADWRGSSALPYLLSRAVALANAMKLWKFTPSETVAEPDSEEQLCVRIWWSLVLMDRWYAAGTGKPAQIPDSSVVVPAGLENAVGEVCFYLIRLSKLLNRISYVISTLPPGKSTADGSMAAILVDYIENYREDLPDHVEASSYPLVHLAYWHCRLLVTLLTPGATPAESFWPTKELASLLLANGQLSSPLVNHFVSLVALSIAKLARTDSSREEASRIIKEIQERPSGGHWDGVKDKLADLLKPSAAQVTAEAAASHGLQHLADLATAGGKGDDTAFATSLASGYLDAA